MSNSARIIHGFHRWVEDNRITGTDGLGNPAHYVPRESLKDYWQAPDHSDRIANLFASHGYANLAVELVAERYIGTLSILAYISIGDRLDTSFIDSFYKKNLDDHLLPFKDKPPAFPEAPNGIDVWKRFQEHQYLFCPVAFGDNQGNACFKWRTQELLPKAVLPLTIVQSLSGRNQANASNAKVKKCKLHKSSNLGNIPNNEIVIKEFDPDEHDWSFKNEVDAYIALGNTARQNKLEPQIAKHFLKYYGSFEKDRRGFIILEYANEGSLRHFFEHARPPRGSLELYNLWHSFSHLFIGLAIIHNLDDGNESGRNAQQDWAVRCVHQDLKPDNIFVFSDGTDTEGSRHYRFKIGDFGMSSLAIVESRCRRFKLHDNHSTKVYGAPELTHYHPELDDINYRATSHVDIWSIGCVMCDILVWTNLGPEGLAEFFELRRDETDRFPDHRQAGYSGCFHNGVCRLGAVDYMIGRALQTRRIFDNVSDGIGALVLRDMLIPKDDVRAEANILESRLKTVLRACAPNISRTLWQMPTISYYDTDAESAKSPEEGSFRMGTYPTGQEILAVNGTLHRAASGNLSDEPSPPASPYGLAIRQVHGNSSYHQRSRSSLHTLTPAIRPPGRPHSHSDVLPAHGHSYIDNYQLLCPPRSVSATTRPSSPRDMRAPTIKSVESTESISRDLLATPRSETITESIHIGSINLPVDGEQVHETPLPTPIHSAPLPVKQKPNANASYAMVSIDQVLAWIERRKNNKSEPNLEHYDRAISKIKNREQIFLVDDSTTMKPHWQDVLDTTRALSYLVKSADPNGIIELSVTSNAASFHKTRKYETSSLSQFLKQQEGGRDVGACNMEESLGAILDRVKSTISPERVVLGRKKTARPVNVYILTDAKWENDHSKSCGVDELIKRLTEFMKSRSLNRTLVSLQFIQFGDSDVAHKRLEYLDDELGQELEFDIVDHRHWKRDSVWHMLVGSTSRETDGNNTASQTRP